MWFRNLQVFTLSNTDFIPQLERELRDNTDQGHTLKIPSTHLSAADVTPLTEEYDFVKGLRATTFVFTELKKDIPASLVQEKVAERVAQSTDGNHSTMQIKAEVIAELAKQAFVKPKHTMFYINTELKILVIDSSSIRTAELLVKKLAKLDTALALHPLRAQIEQHDTYIHWLTRIVDGLSAGPFSLGDACKLFHPQEPKTVVTFRHSDLGTKSVDELLDDGMQASAVNLFSDYCELTIDHAFHFKSIKPSLDTSANIAEIDYDDDYAMCRDRMDYLAELHADIVMDLLDAFNSYVKEATENSLT